MQPSEEAITNVVETRLRDEIRRGVQTIQYQVVTLLTTNGQAPFITVFMYLNEARDEREKKDLAMIIEEMLLQRYQAYGDLYEGLSYDILRVMMNARTHPQVLYSAYVSGLAALDAKRTAALESLAALTGGNVLPWLSEDVLQQLEWSLRATIERTLPSIVPDLLVKGIMAFSLGMLLCWRKFPDAEDTPTADRWFMPTPLGISMAVLLLLSAAQLFTTNATVALAASLLGSVAFWSFAVQSVSAQNFAMLRAGATRGRRWFLTILMVLFVPILPMFAGCVDQIRDPRGLRDDRHRKDDDFSDF